MSNQYTIYLSERKAFSVTALIEHALKDIKDAVKDKPIVLTRFDLIQGYTSTDKPGIAYGFYYIPTRLGDEETRP